MTNVIEFKKPDFLSYITDENGKPCGVKSGDLSIYAERNMVCVDVFGSEDVFSIEQFNQICIAWLALHDPDVLKSDE